MISVSFIDHQKSLQVQREFICWVKRKTKYRKEDKKKDGIKTVYLQKGLEMCFKYHHRK